MQRDEFEMLCGIYSDDLVVISDDPVIEFSIRIVSEAPMTIGLLAEARIVSAPYVMDLVVTFSKGYPETRHFEYAIECPKINRLERDEVNRVVKGVFETFVGFPCVQAVVEALKPAVLAIRQLQADDLLLDELQSSENAQSEELNPSSQLDWSLAETVLGRRCIYFHHILCSYKRRCIQRWSRELHLVGFCKIGYPGILIVEGPEVCCAEYVRLLQLLRWKLMVVRGEEKINVGKAARPYQSLRQILSDGVSETVDSSEIATWCRSCDLEALFKTSMKIYS